jgi:hypothetical protein
LSDWAGGVRRFAREEGQLSRSEFKLLEAFEVFDISVPQKGLALDLGLHRADGREFFGQRDFESLLWIPQNWMDVSVEILGFNTFRRSRSGICQHMSDETRLI